MVAQITRGYSDLSKTGAISMMDEKIANQQNECTGRYLTQNEFYKTANKWLIALVGVAVVTISAVIGWSYRPLGEIRELSTKVQVIQNDITYIKQKFK